LLAGKVDAALDVNPLGDAVDALLGHRCAIPMRHRSLTLTNDGRSNWSLIFSELLFEFEFALNLLDLELVFVALALTHLFGEVIFLTFDFDEIA
jgi:hypothetical protein